MFYQYSLIVPCECENRFNCVSIYNSDDRYVLTGFVEIRLYIRPSGTVKRNVIHCPKRRASDEVLFVFPDTVYMTAHHVDILD